ncbi:MAG: radical SAM protein [Desulfobacterota bacterium]|nr:radical SAM protein [Thermodesulfobacteriota bacterium]
MKIVLFEHPRCDSDAHYQDVANAPLHSCLMSGYVASVLQQDGYDVTLYNAYLAGDDFDTALQRLCRIPCDLLGVHAVYFWEHTPKLFDMLAAFKAARPDSTVVLYGIFPTSWWKYLHGQHTYIDGIVLGEPELTFRDIVRFRSTGKRFADADIPGVAIRRNGRPVITGLRPVIDQLDALPFPMRQSTLLRAIGGSVLGSRGCTMSCSFCCINPFYGIRRWRGRRPAAIAEEIRTLLPLLETRYIYFLDADVFGPRSQRTVRAIQLAEVLGELHLKFGLEARPTDIDRHIVASLVDAGLQDVFLGIESGSAASLRRMRKPGVPTSSLTAIRLLREYGVRVTPGFIMFEPDGVLEDVCENLMFLEKAQLLENLEVTAHVLYHREIFLGCMPNFSRYETDGRFYARDTLGYEGWPRYVDPRVAFLADVMSQVCRHVLRMMDSPNSLLWRHGSNRAVAARVNRYLVEFFKECYDRLRRNEIPLTIQSQALWQEAARNDISRLCYEENSTAHTC